MSADYELGGQLVFQGIPIVLDETMEHGHAALYLISAEAAMALIEAGQEHWLLKKEQA